MNTKKHMDSKNKKECVKLEYNFFSFFFFKAEAVFSFEILHVHIQKKIFWGP